MLRERIRDLTADHSRTLLVALGVLWGTTGLTVLLAFGGGMDEKMGTAKHAHGKDLIRVSGGSTTMPFQGMPAGRSVPLRPEDAELLADRVPAARAVGLEMMSSGRAIEFEETRINGRVHGIDALFPDLRNLTALPGGRVLNELDIRDGRSVAFVGARIGERVFGSVEPVGREIRIGGQPYTVVGVARTRTTLTNYNGQDEDKIWIPWTTFRAQWGWRYVSYLMVGLHDASLEPEAIDSIYAAISSRYGFDPNDRRAVSVRSYVEMLREVDTIMGAVRIFTRIVGVLGLLVAVVGVANVMFVMVEERTREFGIRLAIGETPRSIAYGRVLEGLVITFSGGVVGVAFSAFVLWGFNQIPLGEARDYLGTPEVSLGVAVAVALTLGTAGMAAGYYPARHAAAMDPVDALREE